MPVCYVLYGVAIWLLLGMQCALRSSVSAMRPQLGARRQTVMCACRLPLKYLLWQVVYTTEPGTAPCSKTWEHYAELPPADHLSSRAQTRDHYEPRPQTTAGPCKAQFLS